MNRLSVPPGHEAAFGGPAPSGRLGFGRPVSCPDGPLGEVADLVIDPITNRVTHLVVQASHLPGGSRLVPIELVRCDQANSEVSVRCTVEEATGLPRVQEVQYLRPGQVPIEDADHDIGVQDVYLMPSNEAGAFVDLQPDPEPDIVMSYDRVPKGTVEIRHSSAVTSADGDELGRLDGVCLEVGLVTHIILRRGHLWRRHELMVPVADVAKMTTDEVVLRLTRHQLNALRGP
jgi:uncharacterized protein YrrD